MNKPILELPGSVKTIVNKGHIVVETTILKGLNLKINGETSLRSLERMVLVNRPFY